MAQGISAGYSGATKIILGYEHAAHHDKWIIHSLAQLLDHSRAIAAVGRGLHSLGLLAMDGRLQCPTNGQSLRSVREGLQSDYRGVPSRGYEGLEELTDSGEVIKFYEEAEDVLSHLPRLGISMILRKVKSKEDSQMWTATPYSISGFQKIIQRLRAELKIPSRFTLDACRHGGMTELEEAELTDGQGRALSAHTSNAYNSYAKRTLKRALAATRKRHAHVLANKAETSIQNGEMSPFRMENGRPNNQLEDNENLAGAPGFEPGDGGIKIRCLTTWLRPSSVGKAPVLAAAFVHRNVYVWDPARCSRPYRPPPAMEGNAENHAQLTVSTG